MKKALWLLNTPSQYIGPVIQRDITKTEAIQKQIMKAGGRRVSTLHCIIEDGLVLSNIFCVSLSVSGELLTNYLHKRTE